MRYIDLSVVFFILHDRRFFDNWSLPRQDVGCQSGLTSVMASLTCSQGCLKCLLVKMKMTSSVNPPGRNVRLYLESNLDQSAKLKIEKDHASVWN